MKVSKSDQVFEKVKRDLNYHANQITSTLKVVLDATGYLSMVSAELINMQNHLDKWMLAVESKDGKKKAPEDCLSFLSKYSHLVSWQIELAARLVGVMDHVSEAVAIPTDFKPTSASAKTAEKQKRKWFNFCEVSTLIHRLSGCTVSVLEPIPITRF